MHEKTIEYFKDDYRKVLHMYLVHIFPAISVVIMFLTTDLQMTPSHFKGFIPIGLIYSIINYWATIRNGEPVYSFLTWEDYKTPLILVGMMIGFSAFYWLMAHASIILNQSKKKKAKGAKIN